MSAFTKTDLTTLQDRANKITEMTPHNFINLFEIYFTLIHQTEFADEETADSAESLALEVAHDLLTVKSKIIKPLNTEKNFLTSLGNTTALIELLKIITAHLDLTPEIEVSFTIKIIHKIVTQIERDNKMPSESSLAVFFQITNELHKMNMNLFPIPNIFHSSKKLELHLSDFQLNIETKIKEWNHLRTDLRAIKKFCTDCAEDCENNSYMRLKENFSEIAHYLRNRYSDFPIKDYPFNNIKSEVITLLLPIGLLAQYCARPIPVSPTKGIFLQRRISYWAEFQTLSLKCAALVPMYKCLKIHIPKLKEKQESEKDEETPCPIGNQIIATTQDGMSIPFNEFLYAENKTEFLTRLFEHSPPAGAPSYNPQ